MQVVLAAVRECGHAFAYAASELRSSRPMVLSAVRINGEALQFAATELRADRDVRGWGGTSSLLAA